MEKVAIGRHCCAQSTNRAAYVGLLEDDLRDELDELARALAGVRICNINSTAAGGGVAELLSRELPLLRALGVTVDWWTVHGEQRFFEVTKALHNALQGAHPQLGADFRDVYLAQNEESAKLFDEKYDVYIVHDPQPAGIGRFRRRAGERWIWRCHIDSSSPDGDVWSFLRPFVEEHDAQVFTMAEFVPADLAGTRVAIIPPGIDPLSSKNMPLPEGLAKRIVADAGVDLKRPIVVQVSRFDPWKDPLGVVRAHQLVSKEIPGVQLALVGALAGDDPEGWRILSEVQRAIAGNPDVYVLTNLTGIGNVEVNAFQTAADVVVQKSIKEGFGLVVSEALWKGRPIVAGRTGGIPMQVPAEFQRFLVTDVDDCAEAIVALLRDTELRDAFGRAGREHVRREFLLPRMVRDELRLVRGLLGDSDR